jgi:hypothetical protein
VSDGLTFCNLFVDLGAMEQCVATEIITEAGKDRKPDSESGIGIMALGDTHHNAPADLHLLKQFNSLLAFFVAHSQLRDRYPQLYKYAESLFGVPSDKNVYDLAASASIRGITDPKILEVCTPRSRANSAFCSCIPTKLRRSIYIFRIQPT